jgi:hypothetical protein
MSAFGFGKGRISAMKKLSRKQWILVLIVVVIGGAILRSATNQGPAIPKDKSVLVQDAAPVATIGFDKPLDLGGGVSVTVSAPTKFTATQFMTNYDQKAKTANFFTVTIMNGGKSPLDFSTVSLEADSGANVCFDVLGDQDINGAPTDPLKAGATASYKYGVGCKAASGDPLNLTVRIGDKTVAVEGKLA